MNCELMMEWMQRFVDEDLTQTEELSLMNHISQCPDCAASFEQLQRLSAELSLLPMVVPPFSIVDSILPRLAELDAEQAAIKVAYLPTTKHEKKPIFSWKIGAGFVAAAIFVSVITVNLMPITNHNASDNMLMNKELSVGTADRGSNTEGAAAKKDAKSEQPTADYSVSEDKVTMQFNEKIGTESSKSPTVSVDATTYSKQILKTAPAISPSPTPAPSATKPAVDDNNLMFSNSRGVNSANQTLASNDGNFIGLVEQQIVQVQTPDGNRIYTSSIQWKSTDTIRLLLWQDNQRLTYEVKMEDGHLKRYIIDPILKTEQEQKN